MEWLKELLKAKGHEIGEDVLSDIQKEMPKHFMPKAEYNAKLEEIKGLNTQISERDSQLKTLQDAAGDNEELKRQITELQNANKQAKTDFEKQMGELRFEAALDKGISRAKALDVDLVKVKLDRSTMKLNEDGTIAGLDEQLKGVQESYGYLFEGNETKIDGAKPAVGEGGGIGVVDPFLQGFLG